MAHFDIPSRLFMSSPVITVGPAASLEAARDLLNENSISSLAVVDGSDFLGVLSRTDLLRVARREAGSQHGADNLTFPAKPVSEIMNRDVAAISADDTVHEAAARMVKNGYHRVFLNDTDGLAGVLSTRDVMVAIRDKRVMLPISEFMSAPLFTVRASEPISLATERLEKAHVSGLVVVEDEWPVGLFAQVDALAAQKLPRDTPIEEAMNTAFVCMPHDTPMHRAAAQAASLRARRVIAVKKRDMVGILTGIDFARLAAR